MVDDLRQHRRQPHVAANLQATAGEQLFDVGHAGHDPEEILFSDFDGHVRARMAADLGAAAGLDLRPISQLRAKSELENTFNADGAGIGEQFAQDALQIHGEPSLLVLSERLTSTCVGDLAGVD